MLIPLTFGDPKEGMVRMLTQPFGNGTADPLIFF
jgi:hypothetical protein